MKLIKICGSDPAQKQRIVEVLLKRYQREIGKVWRRSLFTWQSPTPSEVIKIAGHLTTPDEETYLLFMLTGVHLIEGSAYPEVLVKEKLPLYEATPDTVREMEVLLMKDTAKQLLWQQRLFVHRLLRGGWKTGPDVPHAGRGIAVDLSRYNKPYCKAVCSSSTTGYLLTPSLHGEVIRTAKPS